MFLLTEKKCVYGKHDALCDFLCFDVTLELFCFKKILILPTLVTDHKRIPPVANLLWEEVVPTE